MSPDENTSIVTILFTDIEGSWSSSMAPRPGRSFSIGSVVLTLPKFPELNYWFPPQLSAALAHTERADERIRVFHGPTPPEDREEIKRAFNAPPESNPVRILIAPGVQIFLCPFPR